MGNERMNVRIVSSVTCTLLLFASMTIAQTEKKNEVSFKANVFPIIKARCMPCHAEDNFNPSELSLDSYELLVKGGKSGMPFKVGKASESLLIKKFDAKPPFGDRMPLNSKRKIAEGKAIWLNAEEVKTIATWIDQGAKDN